MNIMVCVKRVPLTQDVDLKIDSSGRRIDKSRLAYVINEWDSYAAEEGVLLKEQLGATLTVVTIGSKEDEEVLRKVLAMGADRAIRIDPGDRILDGAVISKILAQIAKHNQIELVLTGVQADDFNEGLVGSMIAGRLGVAHAAVVNGLVMLPDGSADVRVELEGGIDEIFNLQLPAVLTIQSGINQPRYVSIMAVRKAANKEMAVIRLEDLKLSEADLTPHTVIERIYRPPETGGAEIIKGNPGEVADILFKILKEKGALES
jgi:electron transfer flavoprotein beta subunit